MLQFRGATLKDIKIRKYKCRKCEYTEIERIYLKKHVQPVVTNNLREGYSGYIPSSIKICENMLNKKV